MKIFGAWISGVLLAGALSGCCGGAGGCGCDWSPVPYSCNNPYECGSCNFWGVGHYCRQYGFLCRPCEPTCNACCIVPADYVPAQSPEAPVAPAALPYDSEPAAPPVPAPDP